MNARTHSPMLVQMLELLIKADLVRTIKGLPHLTEAERRIALGRALRHGVVEELARELVSEEVSLAALSGRDISDALAEALLATTEPTSTC